MVRLLLDDRGRAVVRSGLAFAGLTIAFALLLASPAEAAKRPKETVAPSAPDLLMDGGRKLTFERSFSLEREVKPKRSFWTRVVDVIAGRRPIGDLDQIVKDWVNSGGNQIRSEYEQGLAAA